MGDRTAKFRLSVVRVAECQFADDVVLYHRSREHQKTVAKKFVEEASKWGLIVSVRKTKGMVVGENLGDGDVAPVQVESEEIEMVHFA